MSKLTEAIDANRKKRATGAPEPRQSGGTSTLTGAIDRARRGERVERTTGPSGTARGAIPTRHSMVSSWMEEREQARERRRAAEDPLAGLEQAARDRVRAQYEERVSALDRLRGQAEEAERDRNWASAIGSTGTRAGLLDRVRPDRAEELAGAAGRYDDLRRQISQLEQEVQRGKDQQTWMRYQDYLTTEDFDQYSAQGAAIENPTQKEAEGYANIFGWRPGAKDVGNIVTYSRDNWESILEGEADRQQMVGRSLYHYMTQDEVGIYNYLLAKEGEASAQEFLDFLEDPLNARYGTQMGEAVRGIDNDLVRGIATGAFAVGGGLDNAASGLQQFVTDERLPTSAAQYGSQYVREDLGDTGPEILGQSLGQAAYDVLYTTANMAPSILASSVLGGLGVPARAAQGLGALTMGASASGNAYGRALAEGKTEDAARNYSLLIGASEAGLQYILGGIGKLGGLVTGRTAEATLQNIDNALLRAAADIGIRMAGEGTEEYLQEILEPALRNLILDENNEIKLVSEDAAYSFLLGALTAGLFESPGAVRGQLMAGRTGGGDAQAGPAVSEQTATEQAAPRADLLSRAAEQAGERGSISGKMADRILSDQEAMEALTQAAGEVVQEGMTQSQRRAAVKEAVNQLAGQRSGTAESGQRQAGSQRPDTPIGPYEGAGRQTDAEVLRSISQVRRAATALGENGSRALTASYDEAVASQYTPEQVVEGFYRVYNAALEGKDPPRVNLPEQVRLAAESSGGLDRVRAEQAQYFGEGAGLVRDGTFQRANLSSRDARRLDALAKALGVEVRFAERVDDGAGHGANAKYADGVITLALDAQDPVMTSVIHEAVHRIRESDPEAYTALADFVQTNMSEEAMGFATEGRGRLYGTDSQDVLTEETVADAFGRMLDGESLDALAEDKRGVVQRVLDVVRDIIAAIRRALNGQNVTLTQAQRGEFQELEGRLREMERTFREALDRAAGRAAGLNGQQRGATMGTPRYSIKDLTEEERGAVLAYKSSDSYKLNAALRSGKTLTDAQQRMVEELDHALEKLPTHEGRVYRRLGFDLEGQEALETFLAEHAAEAMVSYEAFTSSSTELNGYVVEDDLNVLLVLDSETGRDMSGLGNNFEYEVLFPRESNFVVERVDADAQGRPIIYMREVTKNGVARFGGRLYSEERSQTVQQVQEKESEETVHVPSVPRLDSEGDADGRVSGLRAEGEDGTEVERYSRSNREQLDAYIAQYGAIPRGERPYRQVQVPKRTSERQKVSQTVRTILEAGATPEEAVPTIEDLTAQGVFSYDPYSDKQAKADAEAVIRDKGYATALADWLKRVEKGEVSKGNTAEGWALYNAAANAGDMQSAMTILTNMVEHQRNAAQAVQATRILKQLSPEAQLYGVQRSARNLTEELKGKYGKQAPDIRVDPELAEDFLNAKTDKQRERAMQALYRDIGRQMPSRFADKWNAWRYLAMLGNPRTHVRNVVGNAFFAPVVAAKDLTAAAIESAADRVSGGGLGRSKALLGPGSRELLAAAWGDYANVEDQVLGSGKYSDSANVNRSIQEGRVIFRNKALETARRANSRALDLEDSWFSRPHYAYALAQYAKANHITAKQLKSGKGLDRARAYAIREAQKATYRDTNAFSQMVSDLGRYRGNNPAKKGASMVLEGILPFRKTPANILVRGVEYSPLGLLKSLTYDLYQVKQGKMEAWEAIDGLSAGLTGTGLVGLGVLLAAEGLVRGAGAGDDEKKEFDELQGHQAYALEAGGQSYTLDWLAPEALPFFVGVNLWEQTQAEKEDVTLSAMIQAVGNVSEPLLEMSCLQSLNDVFDAVGYASSEDLGALPSILASAATSYLTQAIPTLFGQMERTGQGERMTTYTEKNAFLTPDMQYTLGRASGRIPGLDYQQIPYIDAWGRTEGTGGAAARAADNFLNPAYRSVIETSPMEAELERLYEQTGEAGVLPSRAAKYFTVDGERKDLTAQEYVKYAQQRGQTAYRILSSLTASAAYLQAPEETQVEMVEEAYTYADQTAKAAVSSYEPDGWVKKAQKAARAKIPETQYIALYVQQKELSSLKDQEGETIPNSLSLQVMELVYSVKGLNGEQRQQLFEDFGVGKSVRHYNQTLVKKKLEAMRQQAQ